MEHLTKILNRYKKDETKVFKDATIAAKMPDRRLQDMDPSLPIVAMFGDSLTEYSFFVPGGTGDCLTQLYAGKLNVLNFGYAGRTTANLRETFKDHIIAKLPDNPSPLLFTIWLGANDATLGFANVPIDDFERYLREYIDQVINHATWEPKPKVLLLTPPPINVGHTQPFNNDDEQQEEEEMDLGPAMAEALRKERETALQGIGYRTWNSKRIYAQRVMDIAASYTDEKVVGLDVWNLFEQTAIEETEQTWDEMKLPGTRLPGSKAFPDGYFTDGLHLGKRGYEIVTKALLEKIKGTWSDLLEMEG